MRRSITWGAAGAAILIGVAGARRFGRIGRRPSLTRSDSEVSAELWSLLCAEFGPKAEDFSVTVRNGRVTLRGDVLTLDDIGRLGAEAAVVEGVVNVTNLLRLQPSRKVLHGERSEGNIWLS